MGRTHADDLYRQSLVIPVPVTGTRWVEAVELRPGNNRIVHHAVLQIDRTPLFDSLPCIGGLWTTLES